MTMKPAPEAKGKRALSPAQLRTRDDAAAFDAYVAPGYLAFFTERLVPMIVAGPDARLCHLQCRTGFPDRLLLERLPGAEIYGCDTSEHAIALARANAAKVEGLVADYRVVEGVTTPFPAGAFSHALTLHPLALPSERGALLTELGRIVAPRGQALVATPLRGSFQELADLLRECALKNERTDLTNAVEASSLMLPTEDSIKRELEAAGFEYVEADLRTRTLRFESGQELFEDPAVRLLLLPELRLNLGMADDRPFLYVRDAIDKYWSDGEFELTVKVGVVTGRRKA